MVRGVEAGIEELCSYVWTLCSRSQRSYGAAPSAVRYLLSVSSSSWEQIPQSTDQGLVPGFILSTPVPTLISLKWKIEREHPHCAVHCED